MRPVHLGVVELERNDEARSPQAAFVFAPNQEGVVENAAIHAYSPVDIVPGEGGSADDHAVRQIVVEAGFGCLPGKFQVVFVEKFQVLVERDVTGADFALPVGDDGVHRQPFVPY